MPGGDYSGQAGPAAERRGHVRRLRDAEGLTFRQIAAEVGADLHTVYRDYQRSLRESASLSPEDEARARERKTAQLARIDEQRRDIEMQREHVMEVLTRDGRTVITQSGKVIEGIQDDTVLLCAVDRLVKLDELLVKLDDQEAKLLGLYAATKMQSDVQVSYTVGGGIDPSALT